MFKVLKSGVLAALFIALPFAVNAKDLKTDPSAIVMLQEMPDRRQVLIAKFCPVDASNSFITHCKKKDAFVFDKYLTNSNAKMLNGFGNKYFVQWMAPKHSGKYAFAGGTGGILDYFVRDKTFVVNFKPGLVLVRTHEVIKNKAEEKAAIQRAKHVLAQKYGAASSQMTFKVLKFSPVTCKEHKTVWATGQNCRIR